MVDWEKNLRRGLLMSTAYGITSFMATVIESGGISLVHFAKVFFMMDTSFILGPVFTWLWGWQVWWLNIFIVLAWFISFVMLVDNIQEERNK